jgi:hypothetical protein
MVDPSSRDLSVYDKARLFDLLQAQNAFQLPKAYQMLDKDQKRLEDLNFTDGDNHYVATKSLSGLERKLMPELEADMKECRDLGMIETAEALELLKENKFNMDYMRISRVAMVECTI